AAYKRVDQSEGVTNDSTWALAQRRLQTLAKH
ncbi:MAG: hypothetical protein JWN02_2705, partial [Acidobacteria bacterium]|nr:hypothetical protein [Acidobacteriota bacterium]